MYAHVDTPRLQCVQQQLKLVSVSVSHFQKIDLNINTMNMDSCKRPFWRKKLQPSGHVGRGCIAIKNENVILQGKRHQEI